MPYDPFLDRILAYFEPQVLAPYRERPDRYVFKTDNFEGRITVTSSYYQQLNEAETEKEYIEVLFGYRTLKDGELSIAVFRHDLTEKSRGHVDRWRPYLVKNGDWLDYDSDERFSLWIRRYVEGDWNVENGPAFQLIEEIKLINGLTLEALGLRLYEVGDEPSVNFPTADNTHRYEDAHVGLYGILIDGLSLDCIRMLGVRLNRQLDKGAARTLKALKTVLPQLETEDDFRKPLKTVSDQRGLASHGVRPPATTMKAFEVFSADLESCLKALVILRKAIEAELKMDAKKAKTRQDALEWLPRIARGPLSGSSVQGALQMVGKTIDKVEVGFRKTIKDVHQSELIIIHFTDGSIVSVDTGSNAGNFRCDKHPPEDFHVDFRVHWVPPK